MGYKATVLGMVPSSYWRLSETTGTFADLVGGITGTAVGGVTLGVQGALSATDTDKAVDLDGSTGYITFGDNYDFAGTASFSFALWAYADALPGGTFPRLITKEGANPGWRLIYNSTNGNLTFSRIDSGGASDSATFTAGVVLGSWSHIVGTYDGAVLTLYKDGVAGTPVASTRSLGAGNAGDLTVGSNSPFHNGKIDDVAIWSRALSGAEVLTLYDARLFSPPVVEARIAWRPEQFNKVTNPGFETNTTGWSVSAGINGAGTSITRITSDFHSGVGSGSLVCPATADTGVNFDFGTQTFFQSSVYGIAYRFVVWLKSTSGTTQASIIVGSEGTSSDRRSRDISLTTEWQPFYIDWLPTGTRTDVQLAITNTVAVAMTAKIDDVAVYIRDAHTQVENGYFTTNTTGWTVASSMALAATSITRQTSGGFYGASCGRLVTTSTLFSGASVDLGTAKYTSGRTYRARIYARSISGTTSAYLLFGSLGTVGDRGSGAITLTTSWAAYTANWTPSADRTDVKFGIANGAAAIMTADIDGLEIYEALDDVSADAFAVNGGSPLSYGRGASFDGLSNAAGWANLRLANTGKYSPESSSSVLYGSLEAGKRIHIRAVYDGTPYALFYGQVGRLVPLPMEYALELQCSDPLEELSRMSIHAAESAGSIRSARTAALDGRYITSLNYSAESGPIENLYAYRGTDERGLLEYLEDLNTATASLHFVQPSVYSSIGWQLVSRDRTVHSDASTPSETWDDDLSDLTGYDVTREALVNRQRVDVTAYETTGGRALIEAYVPEAHSPIDDPDGAFYFLLDISGTPPKETLPLTIPANTKRILRFSFNVPIFAMTVASRIGYASGTATATEDEGSTITVLTLEAGSVDAEVESISFAGYPLQQLPLNDSDRSDDESIWIRGERQGNPISSPYIQHPAHADALADWRIWRYRAPRARPTALRVNLFASQLEREVADRVTLNFARLSVSAKVFVIKSLSTTVSNNSHEWTSSYEIEELPAAPAGGWFILGTSALGSDDVLAY